MSRATILVILCCILLPAPFRLMPPGVRDPIAKQTVGQLNRVLRSESASRAAKCEAIFELFANYVRPNADNDFSALFLEHTWIGLARINVMRVVAGVIPVSWNQDTETLYEIALFPNKTGWSDHVIYLTLRRPQLEAQDLVRLLNGQHTGDGGAGIDEFALCHLSQEADCVPFRPWTRIGR